MAKIPEGDRAIENSERKPLPGAARVGAADPNEIVSVSLRIRRRQDAAVSTALSSIATTPYGTRKHLSRETYAANYGASQSDLDQVAAFGKTMGLNVVESNAARRTVVLSGAASQMARAFAVDLSRYQTTTDTYRGYDGSINVPSNLSTIVESIHGLDNRRVSTAQIRAVAAGQTTTPLTPPQVAKLYNFPGNSAAGQTIGILEFGGGFNNTDIQTYFKNTVKMTAPTVTTVGVDGATNTPGSSDDTEVVLDIDVAASVAPGAKIVVYFAPNTTQGWIDAITTAATDTKNRPSVLSISWAGPESSWGSSIADVSKAFQEAAAVGMSIFASSGDGGSGNPAEVLYPASDVGVTGCGGVAIRDVSGSNFSQVTWGGSGGGISNVFPLPAWQSWAKIPASVNPQGHIGRGVPDIAGNADPSSGYTLILNATPSGPWGGTSAVAPFYAGLTAVLNASLDEPLGCMNQSLYTFSGSSVYRDVTSGSNGLYNAGTGWDACTGLGTVVGTAINAALQGLGLRDAVSVTSNVDGRLEAFVVGTDFALWHNAQTTAGGAWSGWSSLGGTLTSDPSVARNSDGRLEIFARGSDDALVHIAQTSAGGGWSAWASLGGILTGDPVVTQNLDGRLEVFGRGADGGLQHIWQMSPGGSWSGWSSLTGNITSDPVLAQNNDGRLEAFARGTDNALWHIWQTSAGGSWSAWSSMAGAVTSMPTVARSADGRLQVFARGTDNALWHIGQIPAGGAWSAWTSLSGSITSDPSAARNKDGSLEVFARGTDNALWHIRQTAASGNWSAWTSLGGAITSDTAIGTNSDGHLEAFARGTDNALWHISQTSAGGAWSGWNSLGGAVVAEQAAHA